MSKDSHYSRRGFLEMLAFSSGATAAAPLIAWLPVRAMASNPTPHFAYVASCDPIASGLYVFAATKKPWRPVQFVATRSPSALAVSSNRQTLFVANCIRTYEGRPAAAVESYGIHPASGRLTLISRQSLALSAVEPRFLAISPDDKHLAVAVTGGGAYNLLPISPDGSLGPVNILRKEIGSGPHPELQKTSRPSQLAFDHEGHLVTTDLGSDRVSSFKPESDSLRLVERWHSPPGSGPASLALNSSAGLLFVGNALNGTVWMHRYDPQLGSLHSATSADVRSGAQLTGLALHPSGEHLVSTWNANNLGGITAWSIRADRSALALLDEATLPGSLVAPVFSGNARTIIALNDSTGAAVSCEVDPDGRLGRFRTLASIAHPTAITLT